MTSFITHKRLRKLLECFQADARISSLVIERASARIRVPEEGALKGLIVPVVSWPAMSVEHTFDWVYQQNGWLQSVAFSVGTGLVGAKISFTRQGEISTTGLLERVLKNFVEPVCKTLHENVQFFQHRSRSDDPRGVARPLVIQLDDRVFADVAENRRFITAVRKMPNSSVSVLHANPYIHLSVLDYNDGSSFDVWVVSTERIVVVPQFRGSLYAIKRLISHVFDTYAEGKVRDFAESNRE